jgi:hypothetical protein
VRRVLVVLAVALTACDAAPAVPPPTQAAARAASPQATRTADPTPAAAVARRVEATAVVEVRPPWAASASPPPVGADDPFMATAVEKIGLLPAARRASRDGRLAVRRRGASWLVEIVVTGENSKSAAAEANAVAHAFVVADIPSRADAETSKRIAALHEKTATADSSLRLLALDRANLLAGCGVDPAAALADARRRFSTFVDAADRAAIDLADAEARRSPAADVHPLRRRKVDMEGRAAEAKKLLDGLAETKGRLDRIDAELERQRVNKAEHLRETAALAPPAGSSVRLVSPAEPSAGRTR